MGILQSKNGAFEKVGECLYRYSNGVYYARIKIDGKDIKRSLFSVLSFGFRPIKDCLGYELDSAIDFDCRRDGPFD
jgi:hypothetical protein